MPEENIQVDPNTPKFAATSVAAGGTTWSAHLVFSSVLVAGKTAIDHPELVVTLPWPLAKAMIGVLQKTVAAYEEREGAVPLPKSYLERLAAQETSKHNG